MPRPCGALVGNFRLLEGSFAQLRVLAEERFLEPSQRRKGGMIMILLDGSDDAVAHLIPHPHWQRRAAAHPFTCRMRALFLGF